MTDDVALVLQKQVLTLLSGQLLAADGVTRVPVYDSVPEPEPGTAIVYPYVAIGDDHVVPDEAEGFERSVSIASTIHVFSARIGRVENKTIVGRIRALLDPAAIALGPDWILVDLVKVGSHVVEDEDGTTTHGTVTFTTLADPA